MMRKREFCIFERASRFAVCFRRGEVLHADIIMQDKPLTMYECENGLGEVLRGMPYHERYCIIGMYAFYPVIIKVLECIAVS